MEQLRKQLKWSKKKTAYAWAKFYQQIENNHNAELTHFKQLEAINNEEKAPRHRRQSRCEGREGPHTLEQEGDQAEAVDFASLEELQHAVAAFPTRPAVLVARFGTSLLVAKSLQVGDAEPPSWLLAQVKEHELSKCY